MITAFSSAADAPYAGKFSDGNLTLELSRQSSGYTGLITLGQRKFPATAHVGGNTLSGTFDSAGHTYPFTATLDSDTLTLTTGGKTYSLKNEAAAPPNPLGNLAPDSSTQPADWTSASRRVQRLPMRRPDMKRWRQRLLGQSLLTRKDHLTTVKAALEATFPELAQFFGSRPVIARAFADAKNPKSGGATFTVTAHGQPMQGFVKCTLDDRGATVAVIYGQTNAPKSEWDKLMNPPAPATQPAGSVAAAADDPVVPLKKVDFPDGTGSIGVADGWMTKAQSAVDPIAILGPANQVVVINNGRNINLPDSLAVRNRQQMQQMTERTRAQLEASAKAIERQTGRPYPPPKAPPPSPCRHCWFLRCSSRWKRLRQ